jgi:predicted DNA-binding transcriptional regulator YafY
MEIIPVVKYWLPHIKVLEPQSVKEVIQKDLEYYLNE